jgi:FkbM family methyltransferase
MKRLIKYILSKSNLKIKRFVSKERKLLKELSMEGLIYRLSKRQTEINSIIDIGASNGQWTDLCLNYLSNKRYHLIEANTFHQNDLQAFIKGKSNITFTIAAAGRNIGEIYFDDKDPYGGLAIETETSSTVKVKQTTIDNEILLNNLRPPFLIKLDTHGYEIPILEGAENSFNKISALIIEVYNFQIAENSLKFYEMCNFFEKKGFYPIDIADCYLRPFDNSFWQMDLLFIRKDSVEFKYNKYK